MSDIAIKFENVSKQYRLGVVGTGTISHDLNRWWHQIRGKEDPYLKIGEVNDRSSKATSDYVWALKDIDFEVRQGDVMGIIGKNGAGKSTLLKLLSRVTSPTTGAIKAKGRIASLLEVGTGFHPELTGRENIYMNGAIMGMTKAEITSKLDEIVDFAGVEKYIDTPSKRYSSGMTVRLGFAIAAHLDPEILVVDEVLAVGDAEFQKKAIGKMQDVSQGQGRTVLFVSHNMGVISSLCHNCILLSDGTVKNIGSTGQIINEYMSHGIGETSGYSFDDSTPKSGQKLKIRSVKVLNANFNIVSDLENLNNGYIEISFDVLEEGRGYDVGFELMHAHLGVIFSSSLKDKDTAKNDSRIYKKGKYTYRIELPCQLLKEGEYALRVASAIPKVEMLDEYKKETRFSILDSYSPSAKTTEGRSGAINLTIPWNEI